MRGVEQRLELYHDGIALPGIAAYPYPPFPRHGGFGKDLSDDASHFAE